MIRGLRPVAYLRHAVLCGLVVAPCLGCAGYHVGTRSLYRSDIQTVHVPVFDSAGFRLDLGERLTEAVAKEIEAKTPYKVVSDANADSVLTGRIVTDQKRTLALNRNDEPRNVEMGFLVQVAWHDRRGNPIGQPVSVPLFPSLLSVSQAANYVPEAGQSITGAQLRAIDRLAEQIVAQLETPW